MKQVISSERKPIKLWLSDLENGALAQAKNLANLPFAYKHIAIMPDSHQGYGMPIGSILATEKVIVPNAVGVDIGCGMCAMRTSLTELPKETLKETLKIARQLIPVGFNWHKEAQDPHWMPEGADELPIVQRTFTKGTKQVGTLGGGNHFVEIQQGSDGYIWLMIHSGSRALGYTVADYYNKLAIKLNERYHSCVERKWDLAFLPLETPEARAYWHEMTYCIEYAVSNRKLMMERLVEALHIAAGDFECDDIINKPHNFAAWEKHFGKNVIVHRKGATRAFKDELGMIPGSQGSSSYIVRGLGNEQSFMSCSHGAGRKLGRKQAQRTLNLKEEVAALNRQGVVHAIRHASDLDEAPGAYKDIDTVMANQEDLVEIVVQLRPLAVMKG